MKKLSDYKGDEAIELWADLLDPLTVIIGDEKIRDVISSGKPRVEIAKELIKAHKNEVVEIMLRIDPAPIDGLNLITRLIVLLADIGSSEEVKSFFGYAEQAQTASESFGSVMENTEVAEK